MLGDVEGVCGVQRQHGDGRNHQEENADAEDDQGVLLACEVAQEEREDQEAAVEDPDEDEVGVGGKDGGEGDPADQDGCEEEQGQDGRFGVGRGLLCPDAEKPDDDFDDDAG